MKIALIGYGKMGHAIERQALSRGHEIVARIDAENIEDIDSDAFRSADVAIEFTMPSVAVDNYYRAFAQGVPVVSGTTGWTSRMDEVKKNCADNGNTFFWTSNFSIGVNLFFALNKYLSALMSGFPQYRPKMREIHHVHKLDHPSGTAITLAEGLASMSCGRISGWTEKPGDSSGKLLIEHERIGEVPGTHIVEWDSPVDTITIEHRAKSRDGFALGAVMAAEWISGKSGFLTMDMMMRDVIEQASLHDILKQN